MNCQVRNVLRQMRQKTQAMVDANRKKIAIRKADQLRPRQLVTVSLPAKGPMTGCHKRCQKNRRDRRRNLQEMMLT